MTIIKNNNFLERLAKVSEILIFIYIAECVIGSSGRWIEIGPFSIRMVLFVVCFVTTLPSVMLNIRLLSKNYQIVFTFIFGVYYIICGCIGIFAGNNKQFIIADITTMMALMLLPGMIVTLNSDHAIKKVIDIIFYAAVVLASFVVVLHYVLAFLSDESVNSLNVLINEKALGGLAMLTTGLQRIYFKSQIFFQVAIILGVWKIADKSIKDCWLLLFFEGVLFTGVILSYTRGFWLGLALSLIILLISYPKQIKKYLIILASVIITFMFFVILSNVLYGAPNMLYEIINRFDPNLLAGFNSSNSGLSGLPGDSGALGEVDKNNLNAVNIRNLSLAGLKDKISSKPIFGSGLGTNLDGIRNDGKTEYMYYDLLMKTGLFGLFMSLLVFYGFIYQHIKQSIPEWMRERFNCNFGSKVVRDRFLVIAYLSIAITSFFNPFLFNPMGIMMLSVVCAAIFSQKPLDKEEKKV